MSVALNSIIFKNQIDNTPIDWLLANIGDSVIIEHNISVKESSICSSQAPWILNNTDGYIGLGWVTGGDFSKFKVGDQIKFYNYVFSVDNGDYIIVEKQDQSSIRCAPVSNPTVPGITFAAPATQEEDHVISKLNPITALYYKWNFIENAEALNFYSKVDGSEQLATIKNLNPAGGGVNLPMTFYGQKPYQIGFVEVDEVALSTAPVYSSDFIIRHYTRITPFMLRQQWDDIRAGIAPTDYANLSCVKSVFYYEARGISTDPNDVQTYQEENILGNTGWFNENFNSGLTNYGVSNLQYFSQTTPTIITVPGPQLLTTALNRFRFSIVNPTDSPFVAGQTRIVLNFAKAPNDESEYAGNGRDLLHNFVWETVTLLVDISPASKDGDNFADPTIRSLANCRATFVSANTIEVTGRFIFDQLGIDVFEESNEPRYMMWATVKDHTKNGAVSDRVSLLVDANIFYYQTLFPDLLLFGSKLIPHDVENYADTYIDREKFAEDELVAFTQTTIKRDPLVTTLEYNRYTAKIVAYNTVTQASFILDQKSIVLPTNDIINGAQYFNISQPQPYHVPANEIRKPMIAQTISANIHVFAYPFLNRWEYWEQLLAASPFFNPGQPNDGRNHDWQHYFSGDWIPRYVFELNTKVNGVPALYSDSIDFPIYDRNLVGENTTCVIKTYDPDSGNELIDGTGRKFILGYKNTLIEALFTNNSDGWDPDTVVNIGIEVFEEGGRYGKRRMSSKWNSDSDTWFTPLPGESRTKVTLINTATPPLISYTKAKAEVFLDYQAIAGLVGKNKWKITARSYGNNQSSTFNLIEYGQNYLGSQDVFMIKDDPAPQIVQVLDPKKIDCCSDLVWKVLADANSSDPLKNDQTSFLWWFNKDVIVDVNLSLVVPEQNDEIILTDSDYLGTPYDYGFYTNGQQEKLAGYLIDWKKVLQFYGETKYYVICEATDIFGTMRTYTSDVYCLKQYNVERANKTVRIEYYLNGILGVNYDDRKIKDLGNINWYNQHRFDGLFHYASSNYTTEYVRYENGQDEFITDEQNPEYILKLLPMPTFKHDVLRTDILMADETIITDYNNRNIDNYFKKSVQKISEYAPKWRTLLTKLAPVEITFKPMFNNLKKFRS